MEEAKEPLIKPKGNKGKFKIISYFMFLFYVVFFVIDYNRILKSEVSSIVFVRDFLILYLGSLAFRYNGKYYGQTFLSLLALTIIVTCVAFIDDITKLMQSIQGSETSSIVKYSVLAFFDVACFVVLIIAETIYRKKITYKLSKSKSS
ncbi:hypothetical protein SteCoe_17675 [Stentor coeruleus]|uniref:Uncharacterized protein n=1 Tax=Stentor coeruleus TaxID=5963 RepID=A0A1R2BYK6_9CILI|nr:hypothetical protein SteCoe_17675 [Stentor coeruleus]